MNFFDQNWQLQKWQQGFSKRERTLLTGLSGTAKSLVMANAYEMLLTNILLLLTASFMRMNFMMNCQLCLVKKKFFNFF